MAVQKAAQTAYDSLFALKNLLPAGSSQHLIASIEDCSRLISEHYELRDLHGQVNVVSHESLQRSLKHQKKRRSLAEAALDEQLPAKIGCRLADIWLIRTGLSNPSINPRTLADFMSEFPVDEASSISEASITRARDMFCELIKDGASEHLQQGFAMVASSAGQDRGPTMYIPHLHDEIDLRVRSHAAGNSLSRTRHSKVQNQVLEIWLQDVRFPWFEELVAVMKKDGPTLAATIINAVCRIMDSVGEQLAVALSQGKKLRVIHMVCGDGIPTNTNCLKRVLLQMEKYAEQHGFEYRLLGWRCGSHKSNLPVVIAVGGNPSTNPLCANICRLCKYLINDYSEEFTRNLQVWVFSEMRTRVVAGRHSVEPIHGIREMADLYGSGVLPDKVVRIFTGSLQAATKEELCKEVFAVLFRISSSFALFWQVFEGMPSGFPQPGLLIFGACLRA